MGHAPSGPSSPLPPGQACTALPRPARHCSTAAISVHVHSSLRSSERAGRLPETVSGLTQGPRLRRDSLQRAGWPREARPSPAQPTSAPLGCLWLSQNVQWGESVHWQRHTRRGRRALQTDPLPRAGCHQPLEDRTCPAAWGGSKSRRLPSEGRLCTHTKPRRGSPLRSECPAPSPLAQIRKRNTTTIFTRLFLPRISVPVPPSGGANGPSHINTAASQPQATIRPKPRASALGPARPCPPAPIGARGDGAEGGLELTSEGHLRSQPLDARRTWEGFGNLLGGAWANVPPSWGLGVGLPEGGCGRSRARAGPSDSLCSYWPWWGG